MLLASCGSDQGGEAVDDGATSRPAAVVVNDAAPDDVAAETLDAPPPTAAAPPLIGEAVARAQWARAENRGSCAPLAFAGDGGRRGTPRRAEFSGGWGVALDLPELRSAYGVAGAGLIAADDPPADVQQRRLLQQWPYFRDLARLPQPAFAGYGMVGARAYPAGNAAGRGLHSLAYVRVGGQACTYNVWSRISRAHLETLLDNLRLVGR